MQNNIRRRDTSTTGRTKTIRLGKREENKTRPVLVKLGKEEAAR